MGMIFGYQSVLSAIRFCLGVDVTFHAFGNSLTYMAVSKHSNSIIAFFFSKSRVH